MIGSDIEIAQAATLKPIIQMAQGLRLSCVAEGIEDALALDLLLHADNLHWSADVGKHRKKSV